MSSEIKADKWSPASGTSATIGDSGDTYTIPSGVTLANSGTVTGLPASSISSGTIATARLGSGTASSSTVLFGDQTFKTAPSGTHEKLLSGSVSSATNHDFQNFVDTSKYNYYLIQVSNARGMGTHSPFSFQARTSSGPHTGSDYNFASYGYRSSGNTTYNYGENQGRSLLGSAITGDANMPSALMFYLVVNPASNYGGTHGWGINWGWNTTNSDLQYENFTYRVNYTGTTTGFRMYADSNNATTFDYAIYGIAK